MARSFHSNRRSDASSPESRVPSPESRVPSPESRAPRKNRSVVLFYGVKKSDATRERILDAGLRMASRSGFNGVSLAPLADAVELSKSGLFAHFDSKEALQLALLDYAAEHFR